MTRRNKHRQHRPQLDIDKLIAKYGGPTRVAELLAKCGINVTMKTVSKWGTRNRASNDGILMLLTLTANSEPRVDLSEFLV